jgi:hypothetical protein
MFIMLIDTITKFEPSRWETSSDGNTKNGVRCNRCKTFVIRPIFSNGRVSNITTGSQLREKLRQWQSPSDPSMNHNFASDLQHEGTAGWFCGGSNFEKWKVSGSLLWIHGKRALRPLTLHGFRDLIGAPFRSGIWKEYFMVSRFLSLAYQVPYGYREAPQSSTISKPCRRPD